MIFLLLGPPDPPSGKPSVTSHHTSATITWSSSPYDGGKIVKGYIVEMSSKSTGTWSTVADSCHSLSYTVRDLKPNEIYSFRVRAFNVHGPSEPSVETDPVQLNSIGMHKTVVSNSSITIDW